MLRFLNTLILLFLWSLTTHPVLATENESLTKRPLVILDSHKKVIRDGIAYSAYRDGESPINNDITSKEDILEDLRLISKDWHLIRLYGAGRQTQNILEVIKTNKLPIKVMQGAWISSVQTFEQNDLQIKEAIQHANDFPNIIVALNVGNEIFVDWSAHAFEQDDMQQVIDWIRHVRAATHQPVTVNDDYNFWNKPHSKLIADEIDFIGLQAYAFWNNQTLDNALTWTHETYQKIQDFHPDHTLVLTESGWPTSRVYDGSYEGGLVGKANEENQKLFFERYQNWILNNKITSFYFEAFDEKWKGGENGNPQMAEKNWGVYRSNRTAKLLLQN